jgi:methyl-accepting chemotaxis protein
MRASSLHQTIGFRIGLLVAGAGLLMLVLASFAATRFEGLRQMGQDVADVTHDNVLIGELNKRVYAVVMDSRGMYMAQRPEDLKRFGDGVLKHLDAMDATMKEWVAAEDDPEHRKKLDALATRMAEFADLRRRMVAAGMERGAQAAREIGESNRTIRQQINADLEALAKEHEDEAAALKSGIGAYQSASVLALFAMGGVGLFAGMIGAWLMTRRTITGPINALVGSVEGMAGGSYDKPVPGRERADEVGAIAAAVEGFRLRLSETQAKEAQARAADAAAVQRARHVEAAIARFEADAGTLIGSVQQAVEDIARVSGELDQISQSSDSRAGQLAGTAQEASQNVQAVAASAEELTAAIGNIQSHVERSSETSSVATRDAQRASAIIDELSGAVGKIGDVVRLITAIAEQTNLLALNATIEAARAGEAGRGFAVVASEVKSLATQTAKATEEIDRQIGAVQHATRSAVEAIKGFETTLGAVDEAVTAISAAVSQQSAATAEIARNVTEAAHGADDIARSVQAVTGDVGRTRGASGEVRGAVGRIGSEAARMRKAIDSFLSDIRAA